MTKVLSYSLLRLAQLFALLAITLSAKAQDPQLTQFYASPVYLNPALAGTGQWGGRIALNYRNQWPSLPGTFETFAASYDQYFDKIGGGIGLSVMKDVADDGLLTTQGYSGTYSYRVKAGRKWYFNTGLQASYVQRSIDFSKLRFSDMVKIKQGFVLPTSEVLPNQSVGFANFSAGFVAYTKNFFGGFAVHNITEPNQSFFGNTDAGTTLPRRFTLHSGLVIPLKKQKGNGQSDLTISPHILIMSQQKFMQVNFGFYLNKGPFIAGLWYRQTSPNSDALMALAGFRYEKFRFGYSYDITVSKARPAAPGSHEVSVVYEWKYEKSHTPKPPGCFAF